VLSAIYTIQSDVDNCNDRAERDNVRRKLFEACQRYAEIKEEQSVAESIEKAVASGLIENPVATEDFLEECPICFDEIPKTVPATLCAKLVTTYQRFFCCGAVCCVTCADRMRTHQYIVPLPGAPGVFLGFDPETGATGALETCFNCRSPNHGDEDMVSQIRHNAEAGKSWAQLTLGQIMFDGLYGEAVDYWKAKEWLEPAAEDGNIFAMRLLSRVWEIGFPELHMPPDHEKAKEYLLRAARKGLGLSQYMYALKLREEPDFEEHMIWMTLSAAQGFSLAQGYLGVQFRKFSVREKCVFQEHMFRALYWLRKRPSKERRSPNSTMFRCC
jgi:hypothetical protein